MNEQQYQANIAKLNQAIEQLKTQVSETKTAMMTITDTYLKTLEALRKRNRLLSRLKSYMGEDNFRAVLEQTQPQDKP